MDIKNEFLSVKRRLFDKVYSAGLNPEQCRAVFTVKGPLLVLAGAGSGKTTVLVNRIAYLIKYGDAYFTDDVPSSVDADTVEALKMAECMEPRDIAEILPQLAAEPASPWSILAITFTNKAAGEIKERLLSTFGDRGVADAIWAGTFHSMCLRILRRYGDRLGYREGFSIYDTDDKKRMISLCMDELEIDEKRLSPKAVANAISMAKDSLEGPSDMYSGGDVRGRDLSRIYELYDKKMMEYNAMDFDDIIMRTVELLQADREVREYYQHKFKYVLVDEYQDTNYAQFVLTSLLSEGSRNIMVVGDDDQSIYRFRGATVENILNFDKTYPEATVIKLEQNYRSTGNILSAANAIIRNNGNRHDKRLWCDKGDGDKIVIKEAYDGNDEGRYIVDKISKGVLAEGRRYSDYAVLYRVNALGRALQTAFTKSGMPFRVIGDMGFYDRKEIKDMVAYLSVISSGEDNLRLKRIVNEPKRKIGSATIEAVERIGSMMGLSMLEVMRRSREFEALAKTCDKLLDFTALIDGIRETCRLPSEMITEVFHRSGYRQMLVSEGFEGEGKIEHVEEFVSAALEYEKRAEESGTEPTLLGFLEEVFLISDVDKYDENSDSVVLMTVHAAKGLEFPVVFLAGMEDGIFPSEQNMDSEDEMSEERRLAYVAITRAKERLYITSAKTRMMYGRTAYNRPSVFVREELPGDLTFRDMPRSFGINSNPRQIPKDSGSLGNGEMRRAPQIRTAGIGEKRGAAGFGIERLPQGTRVSHSMFGEGVILSAKDLGGDVLYEVRFASGQTKKLMATFAKLKKI